MKEIIDFIKNNANWIFDGIGVAVITLLLGLFVKDKVQKKNKARNNNIQNNVEGDNKENQEMVNSSNSQQIVVHGDYINGITEKEAKDVYKELYTKSKEEFSAIASDVAEKRVEKLENKIMEEFSKINGAIDSFQDPSFQILLRSAQKTAIMTEREDDYSLLSELLIDKVKNGKDRKANVGIKRAIEIVDEVPAEALTGLTVKYAIERVSPITGNISEGLDVLDTLFGKLIENDLPQGEEWIEQLDVLNLARIDSFGKFIKLEEYYKKSLSGYCCIGIKKDSANYVKAEQLLKENGINNILITNELNSEYVRIPVRNKDAIKDMYEIKYDAITGIRSECKIDASKIKALEDVYDLYENDSKLLEVVYSNFTNKIIERKTLRKIKEWLENIPKSFVTTPTGKILANANAQRIDKGFPPLN